METTVNPKPYIGRPLTTRPQAKSAEILVATDRHCYWDLGFRDY